MSRPIDADALMRAMYHRAFETDGDTMWQSGCWVRYRAIEQTVKEQPTIEPERKTGQWLPDNRPGGGFWVCSCCKFPSEAFAADKLYKYCPVCGVRMEGEG